MLVMDWLEILGRLIDLFLGYRRNEGDIFFLSLLGCDFFENIVYVLVIFVFFGNCGRIC